MVLCNDNESLKNIKEAYVLFPYALYFPRSSFLTEIFPTIIIDDTALALQLLPENVRINAQQKDDKNGIYWNNGISFDVPGSSTERYASFKSFNNASVILLLKSESEVYMYGNGYEPLRFFINEVNPKKIDGLLGYHIQLRGKTTFGPKIFSATAFEINDYLSSALAMPL